MYPFDCILQTRRNKWLINHPRVRRLPVEQRKALREIVARHNRRWAALSRTAQRREIADIEKVVSLLVPEIRQRFNNPGITIEVFFHDQPIVMAGHRHVAVSVMPGWLEQVVEAQLDQASGLLLTHAQKGLSHEWEASWLVSDQGKVRTMSGYIVRSGETYVHASTLRAAYQQSRSGRNGSLVGSRKQVVLRVRPDQTVHGNIGRFTAYLDQPRATLRVVPDGVKDGDVWEVEIIAQSPEVIFRLVERIHSKEEEAQRMAHLISFQEQLISAGVPAMDAGSEMAQAQKDFSDLNGEELVAALQAIVEKKRAARLENAKKVLGADRLGDLLAWEDVLEYARQKGDNPPDQRALFWLNLLARYEGFIRASLQARPDLSGPAVVEMAEQAYAYLVRNPGRGKPGDFAASLMKGVTS